MRSILFLLCEGLLAIFSIILLPVFKRNEKFMFKYVNLFQKVGNKAAGNKLTIINEENLCKEDVYLLVSNHDSIFDLFNIMALTKDKPIGFVAKKELKKVPIVSKWMEYAHTEFIDRDNLKSQMRSITNATKTLRSGHVMGIFPEGTRSEENMEFKAGSLKLALKAKCDIQPVTVVNTAALYERQGKIKSAKTYIIVHKLVAYEQYKDRNMNEVAKEIETLVHETKNQYLKKISNL